MAEDAREEGGTPREGVQDRSRPETSPRGHRAGSRPRGTASAAGRTASASCEPDRPSPPRRQTPLSPSRLFAKSPGAKPIPRPPDSPPDSSTDEDKDEDDDDDEDSELIGRGRRPPAVPAAAQRLRKARAAEAARPGRSSSQRASPKPRRRSRAAAEAFGAAEAAVCDVGEPDEPHLGALNRRFAQLAKGPLGRAMSEARRKLPRSALEGRSLGGRLLRTPRKHHRTSASEFGAAATEARPRLALAHFSRHSPPPPVRENRRLLVRILSPPRVRRFRGGVEIPGQYDAPAGPPRVEEHALLVGFEPEVAVFASKQRPKKICLRGSDGREYVFIAKGSEDLRQDDRVERLFAAMDGLFAADPASKRRAPRPT